MARMVKIAAAAALSSVLAACASSSLEANNPNSQAAPAPPGWTSGAARPATGPRAIMVDLALSMRGQPYRFGGAAPGGFDCSGLVLFAADGAGLKVPRTALEQQRIGMRIARAELHAGDLVFMHLAHKDLHVGIAIDGERFVHAPSTGGYVRIDSLAAATYARGFVGARRIFVAP